MQTLCERISAPHLGHFVIPGSWSFQTELRLLSLLALETFLFGTAISVPSLYESYVSSFSSSSSRSFSSRGSTRPPPQVHVPSFRSRPHSGQRPRQSARAEVARRQGQQQKRLRRLPQIDLPVRRDEHALSVVFPCALDAHRAVQRVRLRQWERFPAARAAHRERKRGFCRDRKVARMVLEHAGKFRRARRRYRRSDLPRPSGQKRAGVLRRRRGVR